MLSRILQIAKFIPIHILLWVLVWLFYIYTFSYAAQDTDFALQFATTLVPITIAATYTFAYYLIPNYLFTKQYILFGLYSLYSVIITLFIVLIVTFFNLIFLSNLDVSQMPLLSRNVVFVMILIYLVVGIVSFIKLLNQNLVTVNRNQELENKLLEGQLHLKQRELHYLRQQIHPHFLFNTLNTVYGFALKKSERTPELILQLSQVLDYILNQIDKPLVPISQEITHLEAYIGLEQVRFEDTLDIIFTKEIIANQQIPPMLFTAFVENAFKHGEAINGKLQINIHLEAQPSHIRFTVTNSVTPQNASAESHGLGITNTRKRLETLYPEKHILEISETATTHRVMLRIDTETI